MAGFRAGSGFVELSLDDRKLQSGISGAMRRIESFRRGVEKVGRTARIAFLAATAKVTAFVSASSGFEQSMARVRALTGATGKQFETLEQQALALGRSTVFSARQSAGAMGYFAQAGFKVNEIVAAMPHALNLAAAGQLDVAQAADITSKIMRGMGLTSAELGHAVDVLTKAFTTANTDLNQLGDAMRYVGPVAKSSGKSIEEITAAIQVLSNAGIQATMAGTSLRRILTALSGGTKAANDAFGELGITMTDSTGRLRPLADIIDDLNRSMGGLGEAERMAMLMQAFGQRAGPAMAELLAQGGDELRQFQTQLEGAGGTAERIANIQLDTLRGSLTILKSSAEGAAIAIGSAMHPAIEALSSTLKRVTDAVTEASPGMLALTAQFLLATTATLGFTVALGFLAAHPIMTALIAIGAAVTFLITRFVEAETVSMALSSTWTKVSEIGGRAWAWLAEVGTSAFDRLSFAVRHWKDITHYALMGATKAVVGFGYDVRHTLLINVPEFLGWLGRNWREVFYDILNFTETVFVNLTQNIKKFFEAVWGYLKGEDWSYAWTPLTKGFQSVLEELPQFTERPLSELEKTIEARMAKIAKRLETARLAEKVGAALSAAWAKASEAGGRALAWLLTDHTPAPAPGAPPPPPPPPEEGPRAKKSPRIRGDFVGAADLWQRMAEHSVGGVDVDKKQLAEQKSTTKAVTDLKRVAEETLKVFKGKNMGWSIAAG